MARKSTVCTGPEMGTKWYSTSGTQLCPFRILYSPGSVKKYIYMNIHDFQFSVKSILLSRGNCET